MSLSEQQLQCALHSTLYVKRAEFREFQLQAVVALYGSQGAKQDGSDRYSAQLQIFKKDHKPGTKSGKAPKYSIDLESAQASAASGSNSCSAEQVGRLFCITTKAGDCYQFRAGSEMECQLWVNITKFLIAFPHSCLPEEPNCDCNFDEVLDSKLYGADSVWPVYISPEEVGSKCSMTGMMVLAMKGRSLRARRSMGKMELYDLLDPAAPMLSCSHDSVRCTGKMGKFVYVELGSRCKAGPGLLWMYFGSKERANMMKDIFFLFLTKQQVYPAKQSSIRKNTSLDCPGPPVPPPRWTSSPKLPPCSPRLSRRCNSPAGLTRKSVSPRRTVPRESPPRQLGYSKTIAHLPPHKSSPLCSRRQLTIPTSPNIAEEGDYDTPPPVPPRPHSSDSTDHAYHELELPHQHHYHELESPNKQGHHYHELESPKKQGHHYHELESPKKQGHDYHELESPKQQGHHYQLESPQKQRHHYDVIEPSSDYQQQKRTAFLKSKSQSMSAAAGKTSSKTHDYHILEC